jgi:hypothetical protein
MTKNMADYTKEELVEARRAIISLISKCEKVQVKLSPGTSQFTLLKNRLNALRIAASLVDGAIEGD